MNQDLTKNKPSLSKLVAQESKFKALVIDDPYFSETPLTESKKVFLESLRKCLREHDNNFILNGEYNETS